MAINNEARLSTTDLETRVERLEKQNRRLKYVIMPMVALMLIGWNFAYDVIQYEGSFWVRDELGNVRATLTTDINTNLGMLTIGSTEETKDNKVSLRTNIELGYRADNRQPYIQINDKGDNQRVYLGIDADGKTVLQLLDKNGRVTWSAPTK